MMASSSSAGIAAVLRRQMMATLPLMVMVIMGRAAAAAGGGRVFCCSVSAASGGFIRGGRCAKQTHVLISWRVVHHNMKIDVDVIRNRSIRRRNGRRHRKETWFCTRS